MTNRHEERKEVHLLQEILHELCAIRKELRDGSAVGGTIYQKEDTIMAAITGTKVGGSSVFQVVWNGAMQPGAPVVWTCPDDPGISFVAVPSDLTGNTVTATDVAPDALTQYTLNVAGTASDSSAVKATAVVPLLVGAATGGTISQLS